MVPLTKYENDVFNIVFLTFFKMNNNLFIIKVFKKKIFSIKINTILFKSLMVVLHQCKFILH